MTQFDWQQSQAVRQAVAGVFPDVGLVECARITHPDLAGPILWANWDTPFEAFDQAANPVTFEPFDFRLSIGRTGTTGALENAGTMTFVFFEPLYQLLRTMTELGLGEPIIVENFVYLESDPSAPAFDPVWTWRSRRLKASKTEMVLELAARTLQRRDSGDRYTYEEWPTLQGWDLER